MCMQNWQELFIFAFAAKSKSPACDSLPPSFNNGYFPLPPKVLIPSVMFKGFIVSRIAFACPSGDREGSTGNINSEPLPLLSELNFKQNK